MFAELAFLVRLAKTALDVALPPKRRFKATLAVN